MPSYQETLRRLTLHDARVLGEALADGVEPRTSGVLEARVEALVRLAALIGHGGPAPAYAHAIEVALASGATYEEMTDSLLLVAPVVGAARVVDAAPKVALAFGYDVESELERPPSHGPVIVAPGSVAGDND